jgi:hypothetical protein
VITLETWRRTTIRIASGTISLGEPAIDHGESLEDIYRIQAPANDETPWLESAEQKKRE